MILEYGLSHPTAVDSSLYGVSNKKCMVLRLEGGDLLYSWSRFSVWHSVPASRYSGTSRVWQVSWVSDKHQINKRWAVDSTGLAISQTESTDHEVSQTENTANEVSEIVSTVHEVSEMVRRWAVGSIKLMMYLTKNVWFRFWLLCFGGLGQIKSWIIFQKIVHLYGFFNGSSPTAADSITHALYLIRLIRVQF